MDIEEVGVRPTGGKESEKDPEEWGKEIRKIGIGGAYIFSDGSLLESWPYWPFFFLFYIYLVPGVSRLPLQ